MGGTIFGLSTTLLTTLASGISGFLFKLFAQNQEMKASQQKHQMDLLAARGASEVERIDKEIELLNARKEYNIAMKDIDPHSSLTRRVLSYGLLIGLLCFAPLYIVMGDLSFFDTFTTTVQNKDGFLGLGRTTSEIIQVIQMRGMPIAWMTGMLEVFAAVIAFYFGGSLAKYRNPYDN